MIDKIADIKLIPLETAHGETRQLESLERDAIVRALERHENRTQAALALGIGRSTLYRKIHEYALENVGAAP